MSICTSSYCQSYPYQCNYLYGCPLPVTPATSRGPVTPPVPSPLPPILTPPPATPGNVTRQQSIDPPSLMPDPDKLPADVTDAFQALENAFQINMTAPDSEVVITAAKKLSQLNMHNEAIQLSTRVFDTLAENDLHFANLNSLNEAGQIRVASLTALGKVDQASEVAAVLKPIRKYIDRMLTDKK